LFGVLTTRKFTKNSRNKCRNRSLKQRIKITAQVTDNEAHKIRLYGLFFFIFFQTRALHI